MFVLFGELFTLNMLALIPIHALPLAKSRLANLLTRAERRDLVFWMIERMLTALREADVFTSIAVVTPDDEVAAWARTHGVTAILQRGGGLNDGLEQGRHWAQESGADALMTLLGDLPLLRPGEVIRFAALAEEFGDHPLVAVAPDRLEQGTNGLLLRPVDALPFAFGAASLPRHWRLSFERRIEPEVFRSPGLAFDVDLPEDVQELIGLKLWSPGHDVRTIIREEEPA